MPHARRACNRLGRCAREIDAEHFSKAWFPASCESCRPPIQLHRIETASYIHIYAALPCGCCSCPFGTERHLAKRVSSIYSLVSAVCFYSSASNDHDSIGRLSSCPCIDSHDGHGIHRVGDTIVTIEGQFYPNTYGLSGCAPFDQNLPTVCDGSDRRVRQEWCRNSWCYVSPSKCDLAIRQGYILGSTTLYYSEATCAHYNQLATTPWPPWPPAPPWPSDPPAPPAPPPCPPAPPAPPPVPPFSPGGEVFCPGGDRDECRILRPRLCTCWQPAQRHPRRSHAASHIHAASQRYPSRLSR